MMKYDKYKERAIKRRENNFFEWCISVSVISEEDVSGCCKRRNIKWTEISTTWMNLVVGNIQYFNIIVIKHF